MFSTYNSGTSTGSNSKRYAPQSNKSCGLFVAFKWRREGKWSTVCICVAYHTPSCARHFFHRQILILHLKLTNTQKMTCSVFSNVRMEAHKNSIQAYYKCLPNSCLRNLVTQALFFGTWTRVVDCVLDALTTVQFPDKMRTCSRWWWYVTHTHTHTHTQTHTHTHTHTYMHALKHIPLCRLLCSPRLADFEMAICLVHRTSAQRQRINTGIYVCLLCNVCYMFVLSCSSCHCVVVP